MSEDSNIFSQNEVKTDSNNLDLIDAMVEKNKKNKMIKNEDGSYAKT
jgi:hypothetical protein